MPTLPLTSLALLAAFAVGAGLGFKWRDNTASLERAQWQHQHAQVIADAQQQARTREQQLSAQMEAIQNDAQSQLDTLESRLAIERAAADTRVRDLARNYATRSARTNSAPAPSCQATETRARLLAELLGELDQLAGAFAAEADRRMIAGKACEQAYRGARKNLD